MNLNLAETSTVTKTATSAEAPVNGGFQPQEASTRLAIEAADTLIDNIDNLIDNDAYDQNHRFVSMALGDLLRKQISENAS